MTPQVLSAQPGPLRLQVTAVFVDPVTFAVNCCCAFTPTDTDPGEIPTDTLPLVMVTVAEPLIEASESEVAVTVTTLGLGVAAGAVYKPVEVIDPQLIPAQPAPETPQTTTLL